MSNVELFTWLEARLWPNIGFTLEQFGGVHAFGFLDIYCTVVMYFYVMCF